MLQRQSCITCGKRLPQVLSMLKRNKSIHWTKYEKRDFPRYKALEYFDDFYKNIYGEKLWRSLRLGLLCNNKYCAVVNNCSNSEEIMTRLEHLGALNMRELFSMQADRLKEESFKEVTKLSSMKVDMDEKMEAVQSAFEMKDRISGYEYVDILDLHTKDARPDAPQEEPNETEYQGKLSLAEGLKDAHIDHDRIIHLKNALSTSTLYQFVPASKIRGIDKMINESSEFEHYKQTLDFPITVEEESVLNFPEHLNVYTYEKCNVTSFPHPERGRTGVYDYYLLDGGSVLPVLALDLQPGDNFLDMCGAPGGKSLTVFQTLLPDSVVCNDIDRNRVERIKKVMSEYLYNTPEKDKIQITQANALYIDEADRYNKILVDVPCTNDRISVNTDKGNWFQSNQMSRRLRLPEMQAELLTNALRLVAPGGTVVYCTCSLSPVQNDGVVQMALKKIWEENEHEIIVKDMTEALKPASIAYHLDENVGMKYGTVVLPHLTANFGPLYFSKLVKV